MIEVSDEQRLMLLSAARVMLGQVVGSVDDAQRDVAWERVFGSSAKALSDAEYVLSLAVESEGNWKRLVNQLR